MRNTVLVVLSVLSVTFGLANFVNAASLTEDDLSVEPPQIRALLNEAMSFDLPMSNPDKIRHAAILYCKASVLGSLEAQYRLGMLYAAGRGIPKNNDFASVMFSLAATQGFAKALDMLEIVNLHTSILPSCVTSPSGLPGLPVVRNHHS